MLQQLCKIRKNVTNENRVTFKNSILEIIIINFTKKKDVYSDIQKVVYLDVYSDIQNRSFAYIYILMTF